MFSTAQVIIQVQTPDLRTGGSRYRVSHRIRFPDRLLGQAVEFQYFSVHHGSKPPKTSTRTPDCASEHIITWHAPVHTNNARTHTKLFALASATAGGNFRAGSNAQNITCTQTLAANLPKCAAKCLRVRRSTRMSRCCETPLPLCTYERHSSDQPLGGHEERSSMT